MGHSIHVQVRRSSQNIVPAITLLSWLLIVSLAILSACSSFTTERLVYDQKDMRIGIGADPTVSSAQQPVTNSHPVDLTPGDVQSLLQVVQVSGWSGTIVGMIEAPRPVALFTPEELSTISGYIATAFHEAKPTERVVFSLPKPGVSYSANRTEGALFFRDRYLHVIVTDHSSFVRADTGGDDLRDIRDTKGMKLWVASPAQAATVPDLEEPRWAPFETIHISLNTKEVLALRNKTQPVHLSRGGTPPPAAVPSRLPTQPSQVGVSPEDLQLQIRELTSSNLELRGRLEEQNKRMEQLNNQLDQLRLELDRAKSKSQSPRKAPAQ
jgi:YbgF-like TolA binding protein